jgi:hypothetical protein
LPVRARGLAVHIYLRANTPAESSDSLEALGVRAEILVVWKRK